MGVPGVVGIGLIGRGAGAWSWLPVRMLTGRSSRPSRVPLDSGAAGSGAADWRTSRAGRSAVAGT
jgi:hypothetical protein